MKGLSSSISSSSCSSNSTVSFDVNMCNSKSATASCLAGIFRRILCSGSLPTHPSDQITVETEFIEKLGEKIVSPATPGIVARLMGLESMPEKPNSISRSRSMNSVDRLVGCDSKQGQHRRVKSFREIPTFVELENEEFFILSFEGGSGRTEFGSKGRKSEMGIGELRKRRGGKWEKMEIGAETMKMKKKEEEQVGERMVLGELNGNETIKRRVDKPNKVKDLSVTSISSKISSRKINNGGKTSTKKKKKKKTTERFESTSEDSSPVSVLDIGQLLVDPEVAISEEGSSLTSSSSRRKLSLEIDNFEPPCPRKDDNLMGEERKIETKPSRCLGSKKKQCHGEESMWDEICKLNEAELFGSNWVPRSMWDHEDLQGIDADFESQIIGQLLEELVDQLNCHSM
ncbi:hypothetical protein UlMin_013174 [Ulmus minor]